MLVYCEWKKRSGSKASPARRYWQSLDKAARQSEKGGKNLVTIDELIVLHILQLKGYKHIVKNVLIYLEQYQD